MAVSPDRLHALVGSDTGWRGIGGGGERGVGQLGRVMFCSVFGSQLAVAECSAALQGCNLGGGGVGVKESK